MELPPYRLPDVRNVFHSLIERVGVFLQRAGTVILAISIVLWALVAFPRTPNRAGDNQAIQVENSYAGQAGHLLEPAIRPLGFDWKIGIGLISSFAARETVISTFGIVSQRWRYRRRSLWIVDSGNARRETSRWCASVDTLGSFVVDGLLCTSLPVHVDCGCC
jgi:Fe2+ transport system protein B